MIALLTRKQALAHYAAVMAIAAAKGPEQVRLAQAQLGRTDLFYLLVFILHREDLNRDWLYDRCREVYLQPDEMLDLWSREHYKSTIITFGLTIQDILNDPEVTFGLFSHTRPIAKAFLAQIKTEMEVNEHLKQLYPDVLWADPKRESPRWSLDKGIVVKRKSNPKESTIEAYGLVDGQPTSKHFQKLVYDDVVTRESVSSEEMIEKTNSAFELSQNLGAEGGAKRGIGTRYHQNDTWAMAIRRKTFTERRHPATDDGTFEGDTVFWTRETFEKKVRDMGRATAAAQLLQDPVADRVHGFDTEWLKYWKAEDWHGFNVYILVDPAGSKKKKGNDYSAFAVVGLGPDKNYYLIDLKRDRLNLTERARMLFSLHRKYQPIGVGYEEYGMQADIEHITYLMDESNYRFNITPLGGKMAKEERIRRLIPPFESGRFYIPVRISFVDQEGKSHDMVRELVDYEFETFPVSLHDDMLDAISRIMDPDLGADFPFQTTELPVELAGRPRAKTSYDVLDY